MTNHCGSFNLQTVIPLLTKMNCLTYHMVCNTLNDKSLWIISLTNCNTLNKKNESSDVSYDLQYP